jgi:Flp pilus assembly protein TadD
MKKFGSVHPLLLFTLFLVATLGLYRGSFNAPVYYDSVFIFDNEQKFASQGFSGALGMFPERPVSTFSFYVNYLLWGLDPYYFRLVNAVLTALTALMVYLVTLSIFRTPVMNDRLDDVQKEWVSAAAGLLFLIHPVQNFVVIYIWQRYVILGTLFYLAALATYLAARSTGSSRRIIGYVATYLLFAAALFSKEFAVSLPLTLLLIEIAFLKEEKKNLLVRAVVYGGATVPLLVVRSFLEKSKVIAQGSANIGDTLFTFYEMSKLTLGDVLVTQCYSLFSYLSLIVLPLPSKILLVTPRVIRGSVTEDPVSLVFVIGALCTGGLGLWLLRRKPLSGFGILFFIITLIPESVLVPQYLFCVYRVTLPMFGVLLVAVDCLTTLSTYLQSRDRALFYTAGMITVLCVVIACFAYLTRIKVLSWRDPVSFWTEVVKEIPSDAPRVEIRGTVDALNFLGLALQKTGKAREAADLHQRAARMDPLRIWTKLYLAKAHMRLGQMGKAEPVLKAVLKLDPRNAEAVMGLALVAMADKQPAESLKFARKAVDLAPNNPKYQNDVGALLMDMGKPQQASSYFRMAVALNPHFSLAYRNLGRSLMEQGDNKQAEAVLRESILVNPADAKAHTDLGVVLFRMGRLRDAESEFLEALRNDPTNNHHKANLMAVRRALHDPGRR